MRPLSVLSTMLLALALLVTPAANAKDFTYLNVTDLPNGPGEGKAPSINDAGDVAFFVGTDAYFYQRSSGTFLNLSSLPGAPPDAWFPRLNNAGNVAMIDPFTRNIWFYESSSQDFTNLATLPNYPGNTGANFLRAIFDLSDANQISLHSGDNNNGDVYVYDHADGSFTKVTDQVGGSVRGRENRINNNDQVLYSGFPDAYLHDLDTQQTVNITDLPGGPGTGLGSISLNDNGDVVIYNSDVIYYQAVGNTFLYLSTLPGFPASVTSTDSNDISNTGEIAFWKEAIYYFDPTDQSFTQLTGQGSVPAGGMESSINQFGEIALNGGLDVFVATPSVTAVSEIPSGQRVLHQNVPNPFNPSTSITYDLPRPGPVSLDVFDAGGRLVRNLIDGHRPAGDGQVRWDGRGIGGQPVPAGVYFYRLRGVAFVQTRKMLLVP